MQVSIPLNATNEEALKKACANLNLQFTINDSKTKLCVNCTDTLDLYRIGQEEVKLRLCSIM